MSVMPSYRISFFIVPNTSYRLPFLGHMHYLFGYSSNDMNKGLDDLFDKYNKDGVFAIHFGSWKIVTLGED